MRPATKGADEEVPERMKVEASSTLCAETISTLGASNPKEIA